MLDSVKIDRETTTQCAIVAKRMKRNETEIFNELMRSSKHNDNIAQLNDEIARIEDDLTFAEVKDRNRRDYLNSHTTTLRAQTLYAPPPSTNVFYRSTSRTAAERVPAHMNVRIDDILLERAEQSHPKNSPLGQSPQAKDHSFSSTALISSSKAPGQNTSPKASSHFGSTIQSKGRPAPLPSIDGRSPYRSRNSVSGGIIGGVGGGSNLLASSAKATGASSLSKPAGRPIADNNLIYNDSPYMLTVGRMRSSSPTALQRKVAEVASTDPAVSPANAAPNGLRQKTTMSRTKGGLGSATQLGKLSPIPAFSETAERLSTSLLNRTTITGEPIPCSDDEDGEITEHQRQHKNKPPTIKEVNEAPWKTRASHEVLIRDPYMRKYGLHKFDTYLYSEKAKDGIRAAARRGSDGCNFDYRGNLKGEGLERGNMGVIGSSVGAGR